MKIRHHTSTTRRLPTGSRVGAVLLRMAATAVAGGLLCATLVRFSPGFGVDESELDARLNATSVAAIRHSHDQERNPARFYAGYLRRMASGDLGFSKALGRPIAELLSDRTPVTIHVMAYGMAAAWALALGLSLSALVFRARVLDTAYNVFSGAFLALPAAAVAVALFRFGAAAEWMLAVVLFPRLYQYLRGVLRKSAGMPHVLLARAKGVGEARILMRHVLLPSSAPLLALAAVSVNLAFGAAVAIEAICDLPGLGQLAWKAAVARDLPVLVVLTLMVTLMTQATGLVSERRRYE